MIEQSNRQKRDDMLKNKLHYRKSVTKFKEDCKKEKLAENKKAQEGRYKTSEKLKQHEENKKVCITKLLSLT